ncbi:hypothetical protein [uncultured Acetobacteroides sp.]|uniref:hypothetical protein n=1 Tax=uncultured Acetobacteroides sp. TaxID=1760811 RepID=UPI0029F53021|nr:hypothetical protein [uncultured Acetobacteroides sp.]
MDRTFLKFYADSTRYNLAFSVLCFVVVSPLAGLVSLPTFGLAVGLLCYRKFHGHQYYFYYNLGITKRRLIAKSVAVNLAIALPGLLVLLIMYLNE